MTQKIRGLVRITEPGNAYCLRCREIQKRESNWIFFHNGFCTNLEGNFTREDLMHISEHFQTAKPRLT
jgi:hypothetical protein